MTDNASKRAAARLGIGADHGDLMDDAERLLSRGDWSERDRLAARSLLARARDLDGDREETAPEPDRRPATASEIAGAHMLGGRRAARELRERGVEK